MKEKLFTASLELDKSVKREFSGCAKSGFLMGLCLPVLLAAFVLCSREYRLLLCAFILVTWLLCTFLNYRNNNRELDRNGGKPIFNSIVITDAGVRIRNPLKEHEEQISFSQILGAWRSENLLYLALGKKNGRLIDLRMVGGGTPEELMDFIRDNCPHWKQKQIPRRFNTEIFGKILIVLAVVGLLISTPGTYGIFPKVTSVRDGVQTLSELGITGISEEVILELEEFQAEHVTDGTYNPISDLLYFAGCGEVNLETWEWTPAESGVYTFDLEAWEISMMYTNFLTGVSAMSRGELEFTDIVEEDTIVDWEAGTGTKTVSFTFRGARYTLQAEMLYDWYDVEFLNEFSRIVSNSGEKDILYLYEGYQMVHVFYGDSDWARQFRNMTGYSLSTEITYY